MTLFVRFAIKLDTKKPLKLSGFLVCIAIPLDYPSFPRRRESSQGGGCEWWFIVKKLAFTRPRFPPTRE